MHNVKSPSLKHAALASLAATAALPTRAAGAPAAPPNGFNSRGLGVHGEPNPYNETGWPEYQEGTFSSQQIASDPPADAVLITGSDFFPHPTPYQRFHNTSDYMLPASCYNCNPKGCMCSKASLDSVNGTGWGIAVNDCAVAQDSPEGMLCYVSNNKQFLPNGTCGEADEVDFGVDGVLGMRHACRLNKAKAGGDGDDTVSMKNNMVEASSGAKSGKAKAVGAAAVAALGTAAAMII